ncbi:putative nucleotide-diphospho-sugar transferase [Kordiimonas marina]|uniref:putative nucleotide-diphospho-sugar transferase n=1 Tax=Kordiimonas marina TaxID=2872312 RepID=UPI001FF5605C|nr:hypothetical protein [Kordiimonas marina]
MANPTFDVAMLATPNIDYYADTTKANWQAYCDRHGYEFTVWREPVLEDMHLIWSKIELMRRHLEKSKADWLVVVDADTMVNRPELPMTYLTEKHPGKDFIISEDVSRRFGIPIPLDTLSVRLCRNRRGPNCGFMMIRNNAYGLDFVTRWLAHGRGDCAHVADIFPREQRILWMTLFHTDRDHIAMLGDEVMRIGNNAFLDKFTTDWSQAFVLHDKRLPQMPA